MTPAPDCTVTLHAGVGTAAHLHTVAGLEAQRAGDLPLAGQHYDAALRAAPGHVEALHLRGMLAHDMGDTDTAARLMQTAGALAPSDESISCNLAAVLLSAMRLPEARRAATHTLALAPAMAEAHANLAAIALAQGDLVQAEASARCALQLRPGWSLALLCLADTLRKRRAHADAEQAYREVLAAEPRHGHALQHLGWMLFRLGRMDQALHFCEQAVLQVNPDAHALTRERDSVVLQNLGRVRLECGQLQEAMETLEQAIERAPSSPRAALFVGMAWDELGEPDEARQWFERVLQLSDGHLEAQERLANLAIKADQHALALRMLDDVLQRAPERSSALSLRGAAKLGLGDGLGALADYRAAIAQAPQSAHLHAALGHALANAGETASAMDSYRAALACHSECIPALVGLLRMAKTRTDAPLKNAALALLDKPHLHALQRSRLHFGLAAYFDATKSWDEAAAHMVEANHLCKSGKAQRNERYDPAAYEAYVDRTIQVFTPELFARLAGHGAASERPVFIVGMPRSGTTLAEQIIASHPQAYGAGERAFAAQGFKLLAERMAQPANGPLDWLPGASREAVQAVAQWHLEALARLNQDAARVVDKMPDNYSLLGWLAVLFPRAHFVHCQRDLRDVALSCWLTDFSKIVWANDMEHLVHRIRQYRRLMAHWERVLPVRLHALRYERLVANQRGESQQLLHAVGLPWDEQCLSFFETRRLVRTASVNQVRQPMYRRAVARWQRYERMLEPVCAAFAHDGA